MSILPRLITSLTIQNFIDISYPQKCSATALLLQFLSTFYKVLLQFKGLLNKNIDDEQLLHKYTPVIRIVNFRNRIYAEAKVNGIEKVCTKKELENGIVI